MALLASLYLTYAGLAQLALAMGKHHSQAFGRVPPPARVKRFRVMGAVLLTAAMSLWAWDRGLGMGLVTWLLWVLPVVGIAMIFGLAYAPRWIARLALVRPG